MFSTIGIIGCGTMGGALAHALAGRCETLLLSNRTPAKAEALAEKTGGRVASASDVAEQSDLLFLGVKPQGLGALLGEIGAALRKRQKECTVVSMAAGVTIAQVRAMAQCPCSVIRIMPNTAVGVGEGMVLMCSEGVSAAVLEDFRAVMVGCGSLDALPEALMDAGSAISGCGPAFVQLFLEALADGGVACGLSRAKARLYAAQMVAGAAKEALVSGASPGTLKDAVCSPGGSTIQGVRALERGRFRSTVMEAVIAAYERTCALGKETT